MPPADRTLPLLLHYLRQHWLSYSLGVVAIICTNWIAVSIPHYIQVSIDLLGADFSNQQQRLTDNLLIMLALAVCMIVVRTLSRILFFNPGRAIECQVKNDMFHKLMALQKGYYDQNPSGGIISKVNNDITGIRMICGFAMMQAFNIITMLSLTPLKMWQLSPKLTLYCILPIIVAFTVVWLGMRVLVRHMRARMKALQRLSAFSVASLSSIDAIKSYEMHPWVLGRFGVESAEMVTRALHMSWVRSFVMPILSNLEHVLKLLILLVGGALVIQENLSLGELTAFITYAVLLTLPLMALGWVTTMIQQGLVGLESVRTVLAEKTPLSETPDLPESESRGLFSNGGLTVNKLSYRFPDGSGDVLQEVSFAIQPGQVIGILGRIGSGKSALINCLNRYLSPPPGSVKLGDRDLGELSFSDVRRSIRTVTQEPFLFSDTVRENIRFTLPEEPEASEQALARVIHAAALQEEVQRFPKQTETLVGEKGIMLSGGQKQRISLARAMTEPCDLLILDNVLSAVDYETERFLLREIHQLLHPETNGKPLVQALLIVSHRVTSMERADHILVLDEGRIVDQGTHPELIRQPGYYQEMWRLQNESPAPEPPELPQLVPAV